MTVSIYFFDSATYSFYRFTIAKVEIDHFCCLNRNVCILKQKSILGKVAAVIDCCVITDIQVDKSLTGLCLEESSTKHT